MCSAQLNARLNALQKVTATPYSSDSKCWSHAHRYVHIHTSILYMHMYCTYVQLHNTHAPSHAQICSQLQTSMDCNVHIVYTDSHSSMLLYMGMVSRAHQVHMCRWCRNSWQLQSLQTCSCMPMFVYSNAPGHLYTSKCH